MLMKKLFVSTSESSVTPRITLKFCFVHLHLFNLHLLGPLQLHLAKPCPPEAD